MTRRRVESWLEWDLTPGSKQVCQQLSCTKGLVSIPSWSHHLSKIPTCTSPRYVTGGKVCPGSLVWQLHSRPGFLSTTRCGSALWLESHALCGRGLDIA